LKAHPDKDGDPGFFRALVMARKAAWREAALDDADDD
jgi:hypothetical protein